jgi:hypothetical protein
MKGLFPLNSLYELTDEGLLDLQRRVEEELEQRAEDPEAQS